MYVSNKMVWCIPGGGRVQIPKYGIGGSSFVWMAANCFYEFMKCCEKWDALFENVLPTNFCLSLIFLSLKINMASWHWPYTVDFYHYCMSCWFCSDKGYVLHGFCLYGICYSLNSPVFVSEYWTDYLCWIDCFVAMLCNLLFFDHCFLHNILVF